MWWYMTDIIHWIHFYFSPLIFVLFVIWNSKSKWRMPISIWLNSDGSCQTPWMSNMIPFCSIKGLLLKKQSVYSGNSNLSPPGDWCKILFCWLWQIKKWVLQFYYWYSCCRPFMIFIIYVLLYLVLAQWLVVLGSKQIYIRWITEHILKLVPIFWERNKRKHS